MIFLLSLFTSSDIISMNFHSLSFFLSLFSREWVNTLIVLQYNETWWLKRHHRQKAMLQSAVVDNFPLSHFSSHSLVEVFHLLKFPKNSSSSRWKILNLQFIHGLHFNLLESVWLGTWNREEDKTFDRHWNIKKREFY